jgi:hypothetical protein
MSAISQTTTAQAVRIIHKMLKLASLQEGGEDYAKMVDGLVQIKVNLHVKDMTQTTSYGVFAQQGRDITLSHPTTHVDCGEVFVKVIELTNISGAKHKISLDPKLNFRVTPLGVGCWTATLAELLAVDEASIEAKIQLLEAKAVVASTSIEKIDLDSKMKQAAMQAWCKSIEPEIVQIIEQTVPKRQFSPQAAADYAKAWCFEQLSVPGWKPVDIRAEQMLGITEGYRKWVIPSYFR